MENNLNNESEQRQQETHVSDSTLRIDDLRIGNYVAYVSAKRDAVATVLRLKHLYFLGDDPTDFNIYYKPIKINDAWLIKLGFKPLNGHELSLWIDEWECLSFFVETHYIGLRKGVKNIWTTGKIKHVHQLQNLYYSLTGKELVIER